MYVTTVKLSENRTAFGDFYGAHIFDKSKENIN